MKIPFTKNSFDFDLLILGSGTAGSIAAHYARSLNKRVAICEAETIGGESPNTTGIPIKTFAHTGNIRQTILHAEKYGISVDKPTLHIQTLQHWKQNVIAKSELRHGTKSFTSAGITVIPHNAYFVSPHEIIAGEEKYSSAKILIATGTRPLIPPIPGLVEAGFYTYKNILEIQSLPSSLVIFGGGETSCELAQLFANMGTKVTIVTRSNSLLHNQENEIRALIQKIFIQQNINVITDAEVVKIEKKF